MRCFEIDLHVPINKTYFVCVWNPFQGDNNKKGKDSDFHYNNLKNVSHCEIWFPSSFDGDLMTCFEDISHSINVGTWPELHVNKAYKITGTTHTWVDVSNWNALDIFRIYMFPYFNHLRYTLSWLLCHNIQTKTCMIWYDTIKKRSLNI